LDISFIPPRIILRTPRYLPALLPKYAPALVSTFFVTFIFINMTTVAKVLSATASKIVVQGSSGYLATSWPVFEGCHINFARK